MENSPGKIFSGKLSLLATAALVMTVCLASRTIIHSTSIGTTIRMADLSGTIRDTQGHPVAALKVSLMNWFGEGFGSAVTDDRGTFDIRHIAPGVYYITFRPLAENSPGQVVIFHVPPHPIHINMIVNRNPSALARARGSASTMG